MTTKKHTLYTKEFLDKLKNELNNVDKFSIDDSIKYLKPELILLQSKGYSLKAICEILKQKGIKITTTLLQSLLSDNVT